MKMYDIGSMKVYDVGRSMRNKFPDTECNGRHSFDVIVNYDGTLIYQVYVGTTFYDEMEVLYTEHFCRYFGFSPEETMMWVLKYGSFLPKHMDEL